MHSLLITHEVGERRWRPDQRTTDRDALRRGLGSASHGVGHARAARRGPSEIHVDAPISVASSTNASGMCEGARAAAEDVSPGECGRGSATASVGTRSRRRSECRRRFRHARHLVGARLVQLPRRRAMRADGRSADASWRPRRILRRAGRRDGLSAAPWGDAWPQGDAARRRSSTRARRRSSTGSTSASTGGWSTAATPRWPARASRRCTR